MKKTIKPARIAFIIIMLTLILAIFVVTLYDLQVVNGDQWSTVAENNRLVYKTVQATRGKTLDRSGTELVSNRVVNNITLDWSALYYGVEGDTNDVLLSLVELTESKGYSYTDTLPISESPFTYTEMSSAQLDYLNTYITYYESDIRKMINSSGDVSLTNSVEQEEDQEDVTVSADALNADNVTAIQLMAFMRNKYDISPEYTSEQTRIIAGVRYEIDLRYIQVGGSYLAIDEYIFAEDVGVDFISAVLEQNYPGVEVQESSVRQYNTTNAAHILGRVSLMTADDVVEYPDYSLNAYVGRDGLEKDFEEYLHGTNGTKVQTVTASGTVINENITEEAKPGDNVITTIDNGLQTVAEAALRTTISAINAGRSSGDQVGGGGVVALDPNNGEVLAIASNPTYSIESFLEDYDQLEKDESKPLLNRATQGVYSPGSTFKMAVALAALSTGVISEWDTVYCDGKFHDLAPSYEPSCMGVHGSVSLREALSVSCNVYFFTLAKRLIDQGYKDVIAQYAEYLGLGTVTGIGLNEVAGVLPTEANISELNIALGQSGTVYDGDLVQIGIGQSVSAFTPVQLASYVATVANGGIRYTPHLFKEAISYDSSQVTDSYTPEVALNLLEIDGIEESYFTAIQEGMVKVASEGTASKYFKDFVVTVAAKTGSAETGQGEDTDGVFVCYAPAENPQIAIAVVIENGGSGSAVIPVAKAMLESYFANDTVEQDLTYENTLLS